MSATYPKPATPLPWTSALWYAHNDADRVFARHAANAFPHLVAALESLKRTHMEADPVALAAVRHALAIARGEATP